MSGLGGQSPLVHRVFLVDDHALVRRGLGALISQEPDLEVCGEAESESSALEATLRLEPDVVIVDLALKEGSGVGLLRAVRLGLPDVKTVVLSMHDDATHVQRALREGARGYVAKVEGVEGIVRALRMVIAGQLYLSPGVLTVSTPEKGSGVRLAVNSIDRLTLRELQVLELIGHGFRTREIAGCLAISTSTVESHREGIKKKLNLSCAAELVQHAFRWVTPRGNA